MKIFHLSDLHIGLKLIEYDLKEDQVYIFNQIVKYAIKEKPDVVVIAGDIYDKAVPSADAVEVFDDFLTALTEALPKVKVMMISGNHDNPQRIDCYRNVLKKQNVYMIGMPPANKDEYMEKVVLEDSHGPVNFYLLPFVRPSMVRNIILGDNEDRTITYDEAVHTLIARENIDTMQRNVFVSHQFYLPMDSFPEDIERMDNEIKSVGNIDVVRADCLEEFDYVALGHIHKPMKVGSEFIRYSGTPIQCSVSERGQEKGIVMVELGKKKHSPKVSVLPLTPLRIVDVIEKTFDEMLAMNDGNVVDDYVRLIVTDEVDFNVIDMQDRLRSKFTLILSIERKNMQNANYNVNITRSKMKDPYELCMEFMPDLDDESKDILKDIINSIREEG